ncbi:hypothetical protein OQH61_04375 [Helicobacter sp. MIT 21-1697]|uniref:hypothetical protein n=1 Tax=Helicobacter sp. MIT 21-1697 TaxID=2993733 RepID=UPI00224B75A1|nr:hypothetical protein [Helicobacter sp. MIT 21-1697]MCX2716968.1 hypothetical protein [Helicobacter sp. MIT 21-1697]
MKITKISFFFMLALYGIILIAFVLLWIVKFVDDHILHTTETYTSYLRFEDPTPNEYALKIGNETFYLDLQDLEQIELMGFYVEKSACKPLSAYKKAKIPVDSMAYIFENGFIHSCGEIKAIPSKFIAKDNQ